MAVQLMGWPKLNKSKVRETESVSTMVVSLAVDDALGALVLAVFFCVYDELVKKDPAVVEHAHDVVVDVLDVGWVTDIADFIANHCQV